MNKEEWRELVNGICRQNIIPKLRKISRKCHPLEFFERYPFGGSEIYRASRTIRFIEDNFDEEDDLMRVFNKDYLSNTLNDLHYSVENSNRLVLKTGVSDVIEEFYEEIAEGMEISDIPEVDFDALREAGSKDPKNELLVLMVRIKKRRTKMHFNSNESSLRYSLEESEKVIVRKKEILKECSPKNPPTKRKIFKGLGGICRGSILTGVDVGLLAGLWPVPLSPDTTTVGAVASIATGIGDIMIAIGELRGE